MFQEPTVINDLAKFGMTLAGSIVVSRLGSLTPQSSRPSIGSPGSPDIAGGPNSGSLYFPSSAFSSPIRPRPSSRRIKKKNRKRFFKSSYFGLLIRAPGFSKFIK